MPGSLDLPRSCLSRTSPHDVLRAYRIGLGSITVVLLLTLVLLLALVLLLTLTSV